MTSGGLVTAAAAADEKAEDEKAGDEKAEDEEAAAAPAAVTFIRNLEESLL
tara:strand:- start:4676 stop:4828 length:153 start_codon:yes stop_codon:yes gene_type:complete